MIFGSFRGMLAGLGVAAGLLSGDAFTRPVAGQAAASRSAVVGHPPEGYAEVSLETAGRRAGLIKGYVARPADDQQRRPAIVALHGCGGLFSATGELRAREADWGQRFVDAGYVVLFPDSFNARGYREICSVSAKDRPIRPQHRAYDAAAAFLWLSKQAFVDPSRMALVGWSNGGSSTLWAASKATKAPVPEIRAAVAFYPGCRVPAQRDDWAPRVPLTILIGSADNWTSPEPCRQLARRHAGDLRLVEYEGAVHGFDAPGSPRRTRSGVGISTSGTGEVEIGTDPKARARATALVMDLLHRAFSTSLPVQKN